MMIISIILILPFIILTQHTMITMMMIMIAILIIILIIITSAPTRTASAAGTTAGPSAWRGEKTG